LTLSAGHPLVQPTTIQCLTDSTFVKAVQRKLDPKEIIVSDPQIGDLLITPLELLLLLGKATAAAIPRWRHPAAVNWAVAKYIDAFADVAPDLALAAWVDRTERGHRRAVLSEDLGVAVCSLVADRTDRGAMLMDVDAYDAVYGHNVVWSVGKSRPDFLSGRTSGSGREFMVWEAKGRTGDPASSSIAGTFVAGAKQTCTLRVERKHQIRRRFVVGAVIGDDRTVGFHAIEVHDTSGRRFRPQSPSSLEKRATENRPEDLDELAVLERFAGGRQRDPLNRQQFEVLGEQFEGSRQDVPTFGGRFTVVTAADQELLDLARSVERQTSARVALDVRSDRRTERIVTEVSPVAQEEAAVAAVDPDGLALRIGWVSEG
jgi:hypothetical protein